ncbi:MAG: FHA domain-containing protein [Thermodesulfobacteriota bacterium]
MAEWAVLLNDRVIHTFSIREGESVVFGRGTEATVTIDNTAISRQHARLEMMRGIYLVTDLGSLNGTFVNGQKIGATTPVTEDDTITIGKFRIAPAGVGTLEAAASISKPMDVEATIFVGGPRTDRTQKSGPATTGIAKHRLTATAGDPQPAALVLDGRTSVKLGKDPSADIRLSGWLVAGTQCYLVLREDKYFLVTQRSWTATRLNGTSVKGEHRLRKGDVITIGKHALRFE